MLERTDHLDVFESAVIRDTTERSALETVAGRDGRTPEEHRAEMADMVRTTIDEAFGIDPSTDRPLAPPDQQRPDGAEIDLGFDIVVRGSTRKPRG